jgi:eukaryotic-like serine/threonine-protein kinase
MLEPGQVIDGKYRIVRLIGEGGMGAVFEGENIRISRRVAIKVLHPNATANPETVQRFEREAQAAGRIGSDHILEILDLGALPDGSRYMVMEFLAGETLSSRIRKHGRLTPGQIVPLMRQMLVGLAAAHDAGIVHRDLKPDNVFVLTERSGIRDYVKIIDFGISKFNVIGGDMSMTRTGAVMGTPFYMSPEQAKGSGQVDHRSDLYAAGVILYEAATGEVPFLASTFNELLFKIVLSEPKPLSEVLPGIDPNFVAVVTRAMAREPSQRFQSAREMIETLDGLGLSGKTQALDPAPAMAPVPAVVRVANTPNPALGAPGQPTLGTFSTSQTGVPKRGTPIALLAGGATLLVMIGGAFAAYKAFSGGGETPAAASAEPSGKADAPATAPPAEATKPEAAKVEPAAPAAPAPTAAVTPSAAVPAPSATAAKAAVTTPRAAPRPRPAGGKPAGGTKSSRDFGY